jgi:hypothetical protein
MEVEDRGPARRGGGAATHGEEAGESQRRSCGAMLSGGRVDTRRLDLGCSQIWAKAGLIWAPFAPICCLGADLVRCLPHGASKACAGILLTDVALCDVVRTSGGLPWLGCCGGGQCSYLHR